MTATTSNAPLVAAVTPVYNGAVYLEELMESVQAQDWPNLVHVVVDNASTDDTPNIIKRYLNGRVPVLTKRNAETVGLIDNWNTAVDFMPDNAAMFRIVCADDRLYPNAFSTPATFAVEHPEVMAVNALGVQIDGSGDVFRRPWESLVGRPSCVLPGKQLGAEYLVQMKNGIRSGQMLWRSEMRARRHPFFSHGAVHLDDDAVYSMFHDIHVGMIYEEIDEQRMHKESVTSTENGANEAGIRDRLYQIETNGPKYFEEAELKKLKRQHVLYYYRWLLKQKYSKASVSRRLYKEHLDHLEQHNLAPNPLGYARAIINRLARPRPWARIAS